jgi:hypothetical protein
LRRIVATDASPPSIRRRKNSNTSRASTGSCRSTSGRDALATHASTSRSSAGICGPPAFGTTNAQCRSARRSTCSSGRPEMGEHIASVIAVSASLTSSRVLAARPGQCARAYSVAKSYQLNRDGPRTP